MEFLQENAEYREIVLAAKTLGINYVAVEKGVLRERVNEMIAKINNGEVENSTTESLEENNQDKKDSEDTSNNDENDNAENDGESKAAEAAKKAAERAKRGQTTRSSSKKWYEEEGAFPYKNGDIVEIIGGPDLIGRKLQVFEPSAKKDMVKGKLIHPITGNLQNTMIAIAFNRIQLLENNDSQEEDQIEENPATNEQIENPAQEVQPEEVANEEEIGNSVQEDQVEEITSGEETEITDEVDQIEETADGEEVENTDKESIIDGSEEELDIPELDEEESEDLKAE